MVSYNRKYRWLVPWLWVFSLNHHSSFLFESNGFLPSAIYDNKLLNGIGGNISPNYTRPPSAPDHFFQINGMNIGYTGDGSDQTWPLPNFGNENKEREVTN